MKSWLHEQWCLSAIDADFICGMEDVLDLYEEPYDPDYPTVCFDEKPFQLLGHVREPIPGEPGKPAREDYTYKRNGTCNLFVMYAPQIGWRHVKVTDRRTALDYAECIKELVDEFFPSCKKMRIVQDNLNTHKGSSFYKRYSAQEARRINKKLEFHYTPKHASWLNMAEIEIHALGKQCLDRRIDDKDILTREVNAWELDRNQCNIAIDWQFNVEKARIKFHKHYEKIIDTEKN